MSTNSSSGLLTLELEYFEISIGNDKEEDGKKSGK